MVRIGRKLSCRISRWISESDRHISIQGLSSHLRATILEEIRRTRHSESVRKSAANQKTEQKTKQKSVSGRESKTPKATTKTANPVLPRSQTPFRRLPHPENKRKTRPNSPNPFPPRARSSEPAMSSSRSTNSTPESPRLPS